VKHIPLKTLSLRGHKTLTERWVHDTIAADPTLLGLGNQPEGQALYFVIASHLSHLNR
jgi:hypothetical protein